ncbi:MAG: type I 3-dehydroquinate dehydratase [Thermodesulfovibrionales bacterium]|nr:type I 3-dehydroquinate dehydratase [Thermodesulfovibrionales bacterium]
MSTKLPLIIASISDVDVREENLEALSYADIIELRIDLFDNITENHVKEIFLKAKNFFKKPLLATIRHPSEGGGQLIENRLQLYRFVEDFISYVDIELAFPSLILSFRETNKKIKIIGSYHNFVQIPHNDIENIINQGYSLPVDIVKIAVMSENTKDILKLLEITDKYRDKNIITIAMGKIGFFSRIAGWLFGSTMTYGHIGEATAPGQATVKEMRELINLLHSRISD